MKALKVLAVIGLAYLAALGCVLIRDETADQDDCGRDDAGGEPA